MLGMEAGDIVGHIAKAASIALGMMLAMLIVRWIGNTKKSQPDSQGQEAEKK